MRIRTVPREGCNSSHWKGGLHRRNCRAPNSYYRAAWKVLDIDEVRLITAVARPFAIADIPFEQRYVMAAVRPFEYDDITGLRRAHGGHSPVQPCRRP
jgi:hypothetical protein